jgi:acyl-CoA dehydrogenase
LNAADNDSPQPAASAGPGPAVTLDALRERVRRFVDDECIPREDPALAHDLARLDGVAAELRELAKRAGVYAPQLPREWGGLALSWLDRSVILEELGRSFLGPLAANCAPPDQPNMINLLQLGSPGQRQRYLKPLVDGAVRSCFAMTEPAPGAGSDPSMLLTRAERTAKGWALNGRKWFISGAVGAAFAIVLAQTDEGPTLFLVDTDTAGYRLVRNIASIDGFQIGGHGEIELADCRRSAAASSTRRRGSSRRASRTACASSAAPCAPWRSPSPT